MVEVCPAAVAIYNPLSSHSLAGSGERVCVLPTAPVDRSHLRLQAAGTRSHQSPQRLLLSDLRGRSQPQLNQRPHAQRGEAYAQSSNNRVFMKKTIRATALVFS